MALRETADQIFPELAQNQRTFLLAGGAGLVVSAVGYATNPAQFFPAYLLAYMLVLGLSLGALAFTMIHQLTGGAWGVVARQSLGASTRVLPYLTVLFVPIIIGMPHLYEWTHADVVAHDEILQGKAAYLNTTFFIVRAAFYFAVWNGLAFMLDKWSKEQDETANPALPLRMQRLSAGGLLLYAFTMTFASFDWIMSRDPHWFSTIYGALIMVGQGLIALAFQIIILTWLARRKPMSDALTTTYLHDLANLMFGFTVLWAYMSFSQYLIIWSGNLPEEITWYLDRMQGGWTALGVTLVIFHFAAPIQVIKMAKFAIGSASTCSNCGSVRCCQSMTRSSRRPSDRRSRTTQERRTKPCRIHPTPAFRRPPAGSRKMSSTSRVSTASASGSRWSRSSPTS